MTKKTNKSLENAIVSQLLQGKTSRNIATNLQVSRTTVQRIAKAKNIHLKSKGGGKKKVTSRDEKFCAKQIISGAAKSVTELTKTLKENHSINVDRRTVARALNNRGLRALEKKKKQGLSQKNIKARLE